METPSVLERFSKMQGRLVYSRDVRGSDNGLLLPVKDPDHLTPYGTLFGGISAFLGLLTALKGHNAELSAFRGSATINYRKALFPGDELTFKSEATGLSQGLVSEETALHTVVGRAELLNSGPSLFTTANSLDEKISGSDVSLHDRRIFCYSPQSTLASNIAKLYQLVAMLDLGTWWLGSAVFPKANFVTGYLEMDVTDEMTGVKAFRLECSKVTKGKTSASVDANVFYGETQIATTKARLVNIDPRTGQSEEVPV